MDIIRLQDLPVGQWDCPQSKVYFEKGKTALKDYHGQLGVLLTAYDYFKQSSETYCYMGVALIVRAASFEGGYNRIGLSIAMGWLDKAKALPHDVLQARLIEADIRSCFDQFEKAHDILNRLPTCLEVKKLRYTLFAQELRISEAEKLYAELADVPEQQELGVGMAWVYFKTNNIARGVEVLCSSLEKYPQDPWLHHTLSLFYFQTGDLKKTRWHNDQTLKLKKFPVALALQKELKKVQTFALKQRLFRTGLYLIFITLSLRIVAESL